MKKVIIKAVQQVASPLTLALGFIFRQFIHLRFYNKIFKFKPAFTLAEVLITLGIVGVVAALTIPTLVKNYQKKLLINQNKQAYSLIINALDRIKAESSTYSYDIFSSEKTIDQSLSLFQKYFKITEANVDSYVYRLMRPSINKYDENKYDLGKTFPNKNFKTNTGMLVGITKYNNCIQIYTKYVFNPDGTVVRDENGVAITETAEREACADIFIDVNAEKMPNQAGKDIFRFTVLRNQYEVTNSSAYGNIKYILQYNDFDPNIIEYEPGAEKT